MGQKIGEKRPHEAGIIGSGIATSVLAGLCLSYLFYTYVLYFDAQKSHRRPNFDQIAIQIIKPDHLLSPTMCHKAVHILDIGI